MTKEERIGYCRYYKGEIECPFKGEDECPFTTGNMAWFWDMECMYTNLRGEFEGERGYYEALGGKKYSGIPYQLLIIMFTSWGKWTYDIKHSIGDFYNLVDEYLFIPNDHEEKIPDKTREALIAQCRYYRGKNKGTSKNATIFGFWFIESCYVRKGGRYPGNREYFESLIDFTRYPGVPHELLLFMMHFWSKWKDIKKSIGDFYKLVDEYLFIPNDHFPEDKIPPEGFKD